MGQETPGPRASESAPNQALEPTRNSLRSCVAPAIARGALPAFGFNGRQQAGMTPTQGDNHVV